MSKKKRSGTFHFSSGINLPGELVITGLETHANVTSDQYFSLDNDPDAWIQATLNDSTQVTLVACQMPSRPGHRSGPSGTQYYARIYPHFILAGDHTINPNDGNVELIRFFVHDHLVLSTDHDVYGSHWDLTDTDRGASGMPKVDAENGLLLYFTGKREIAKADTPLGTVTIEHAPRFTFRHGFGGVIKDRIAASISFEKPLTTLQAVLRSETVARFLSLIIGRRQLVKKTLIETTGGDTLLSVYRRVPMFDGHIGEEPSSFDLLIDVSRDPAQFSEILDRWLQDEPSMASSRASLFRSVSLFTKSISDRLITAANMYDLLPESRLPTMNVVLPLLASAKAAAVLSFKSLEHSPERDSILSALGRLGHPTLKSKIRYQIEKIQAAVPGVFPNLEIVTDQAVTCRNFYVHGTSPSFDYEMHPSSVRFMTEALEFVFISSDLIEAGWKMREWVKKGHAASNQMSSFAVNYRLHWNYFEKLISKIPSPPADTARQG